MHVYNAHVPPGMHIFQNVVWSFLGTWLYAGLGDAVNKTTPQVEDGPTASQTLLVCPAHLAAKVGHVAQMEKSSPQTSCTLPWSMCLEIYTDGLCLGKYKPQSHRLQHIHTQSHAVVIDFVTVQRTQGHQHCVS